jgi:hypothetical protein
MLLDCMNITRKLLFILVLLLSPILASFCYIIALLLVTVCKIRWCMIVRIYPEAHCSY